MAAMETVLIPSRSNVVSMTPISHFFYQDHQMPLLPSEGLSIKTFTSEFDERKRNVQPQAGVASSRSCQGHTPKGYPRFRGHLWQSWCCAYVYQIWCYSIEQRGNCGCFDIPMPWNSILSGLLLIIEVIDLKSRFHGDRPYLETCIPQHGEAEALPFPMIPNLSVCTEVQTISWNIGLLGVWPPV